jgi:hypothetical protein
VLVDGRVGADSAALDATACRCVYLRKRIFSLAETAGSRAIKPVAGHNFRSSLVEMFRYWSTLGARLRSGAIISKKFSVWMPVN